MERHDDRTWFDPRTGDQVSLTYIGLVPDIPAPMDDLPLLRRKLAEETAETGSIIEAHVVSLDGEPTLFQLIKLPIPGQDTGLAFIAAFTVPRDRCSAVLRVQCAEVHMTGRRESTVAAQVGFENCFPPHPYAPDVHGQLPYNVADEAMWDPQFPDHPLTRARTWAQRTLATARLDPRFKALPPFQVQPQAAPLFAEEPAASRHASPVEQPFQPPAPDHPLPLGADTAFASPSPGPDLPHEAATDFELATPPHEPRPLHSAPPRPTTHEAPAHEPPPTYHPAADFELATPAYDMRPPAHAAPSTDLSATFEPATPETQPPADTPGFSATHEAPAHTWQPQPAPHSEPTPEPRPPAHAGPPATDFAARHEAPDHLEPPAPAPQSLPAHPTPRPRADLAGPYESRFAHHEPAAPPHPEPAPAHGAPSGFDLAGAAHQAPRPHLAPPPQTDHAQPAARATPVTARPDTFESPAPPPTGPTPAEPTAAGPTTARWAAEPATAEPATARWTTEPATAEPATARWAAESATSEPTAAAWAAEPNTVEPTTTAPKATGPTATGWAEPATSEPTAAPWTTEPTTTAPAATGWTTEPAATNEPPASHQTAEPATSEPTGAPWTTAPTTTAPTAASWTAEPASSEPTAARWAVEPTTAEPATARWAAEPTAAARWAAEPTAAARWAAEPTAAEPTTTAPAATGWTTEPAATNEPPASHQTAEPATGEPTAVPWTTEPTTAEPTTTAPAATEPTAANWTAEPASSEPTAAPWTTEPTTTEPTTTAPAATEPTAANWTTEPAATNEPPANHQTTEPATSEPPSNRRAAEPATSEPTASPWTTEPNTGEPTTEPTAAEPTASAWVAESAVAEPAVPHPPAAEPASAETGSTSGSEQSPVEVGDVLQTVLVGLPLAGYLPLWQESGVTFWRMKDPDAVRARLGAGVETRSEIDTHRFREAAMFSPSRGTLFLMDRFRDESGHLGGTSTQLEPATEEEAYAAVDDKAISELYGWLGEVVLESVRRGEFVAVESGGWEVPMRPVVLMMLRTDGREWHSVVETSPVPVGAPVWRDQQPVDGTTQVLASPATDQTVRASGLLTRFAVATWGMHPFQLGLSFGPNPTL
jgi:hypothetical protein